MRNLLILVHRAADWAEDKEGRKGKEKICPRNHLTMYVQVCAGLSISLGVVFPPICWWIALLMIVSAFIGWALGYDAGGNGR